MTPAQDRLKRQMVDALLQNLRRRDDLPNVPEAGVLLWRAFLDLDGTRTFSAQGPSPIAYAEIEAWARLMGYALRPWHVDVLRAMDAALIRQFGEEIKRQKGARKAGAKLRSALSPALFDARFAG